MEFVVFEQCMDTTLLVQYARILLKKGTLSRGDIFIVDNCSIHLNGGNIGLQG